MCMAKGGDLMRSLSCKRRLRNWWLTIAVIAAMVPFAVPSSAQASSACADTTSVRSQVYRASYASIVSKTDTASARRRAQTSVPFLQASQVRLVGDTTVCRNASNAFDLARGVSLSETPAIVLELGPSHRIVVKDTGVRHYWQNYLFNSSFTQMIQAIRF